MRVTYSILYLMFFLAFNITVGFSQTSNDRNKIIDLFIKTQKIYESNSVFKFDLNYKLFVSYKSSLVLESYNGIIVKNHHDYYAKIASTEFIKLGKEYIKIDNEGKRMQLKNEEQEGPLKNTYELTNLVSSFSDFKLTSDADFWICTLTAPSITFVPYGKIIIYINKAHLTLDKQVFYLLTQNKYKDIKGNIKKDYPRLEIQFSNFLNKNIDFKSMFKKENYFIKKKLREVPSTLYKDYLIVD